MTPAVQRQVAVLAALLAVLVVVAVVQLRGGNPTPAAPRSTPSNQASGRGGAAAQVPVTDVKLDVLNKAESAYPKPERNPFQFRARQEAPAAGGGRPTQAPESVTPPVPPGPPPLPPIPWRFVGVAELPGGAGRVGAFSDGRGNTTWAKEGDIIDGRYRVLRVGPDSAEVAYADGRGRQSLRLSGQ
jgi:hypothetical protein